MANIIPSGNLNGRLQTDLKNAEMYIRDLGIFFFFLRSFLKINNQLKKYLFAFSRIVENEVRLRN